MITKDLGKSFPFLLRHKNECPSSFPQVHLPADATLSLSLSWFIEEGEVIPRCDAMCTFLISPLDECVCENTRMGDRQRERAPRERNLFINNAFPWPRTPRRPTTTTRRARSAARQLRHSTLWMIRGLASIPQKAFWGTPPLSLV